MHLDINVELSQPTKKINSELKSFGQTHLQNPAMVWKSENEFI